MSRWTLCVLGFLYFLQGMPYGIQIKFLPILLRTHGVSLTDISLFKLLFFPWVFKLLWAPLVDRHGSKRQWLVGTLFFLSLTCTLTSLVDFTDVRFLALLLLVQNVFVSVQDISVDALAVAVLATDDVGLGNVAQVVGYKVGGVVAGGCYMMLHNSFGHGSTYLVLAVFYMLALTLIFNLDLNSIKYTVQPTQRKKEEDRKEETTPASYSHLSTVREAFSVRGTSWLVIYTVLYKCGENGSIAMLPMFLLDRGESDTKVAFCTGIMGSLTTILGSVFGGFILKRYSTYESSYWLNIVRCLAMILIVTLVNVPESAMSQWQHAAYCNILLALCCLQLFLSGISSIVTFAWMMHLSQKAPDRIQSTHYSTLATSEILGKLVFVSVVGYIADTAGYSSTFSLLLFFLGVVTTLTFRTPQCLQTISRT